MIKLINDIREKLNELEERLIETENKKLFPPCNAPMSISYVDLSNCTNAFLLSIASLAIFIPSSIEHFFAI